MIINQWVPAAHKGDAIGDSARRVRDLLRVMGHESELYALTMDDDLRHEVRPFSDGAAKSGDMTIFHYALPSPMTEAFASLRSGRVLQYHNVTPASYFAPYDPALFRLAALGRDEVRTLAGRVDLALGDSEYNRQELDTLGFDRTGVFPIAVDTARITQPARRPALDRILDDDFVNVLFVGRIAPNKKIEDFVKLAELYKRYVDDHAPLHLRRPVRRRAAVLFDDSRPDGRVAGSSTNASCSPVPFPTKSSPSTTATRRSTSR